MKESGRRRHARADVPADPGREAPLTLRTSCCLFVLLLAACGPVADPVTCGPGTHQEGHQCLPDAAEVSPASPDAGSPDAGSSADAGSSPTVSDGEPCPEMGDVCSNNRVFHCGLVPNSPGYGKLFASDDCSLLGGTCVIRPVKYAACEGGGYTACDRRTDLQYCVDDHVLASCNGFWSGIDCSKSATSGAPWVCHTVDRSDAHGLCGPP